jgi:hypothetical protein
MADYFEFHLVAKELAEFSHELLRAETREKTSVHLKYDFTGDDVDLHPPLYDGCVDCVVQEGFKELPPCADQSEHSVGEPFVEE